MGMRWEQNGVRDRDRDKDGVRDRDRDREEHVKRVEWDGNGVGMKGMGTEVELDGVGKGMR